MSPPADFSLLSTSPPSPSLPSLFELLFLPSILLVTTFDQSFSLFIYHHLSSKSSCSYPHAVTSSHLLAFPPSRPPLLSLTLSQWHVEFTYGGSYNGTGQYLADVTILPGELNVEIPYQFYVTTHVGTPLNVGTNANPIAALQVLISIPFLLPPSLSSSPSRTLIDVFLQLDLNYAVSSPIDKDQGSFSYFVQGT